MLDYVNIFEDFTNRSMNAFLVHGTLSIMYATGYRMAERNFFNPDLNPFIYATVYTSINNLWRIFIRREPKFVDNIGVFIGSAAGYMIASYLFE